MTRPQSARFWIIAGLGVVLGVPACSCSSPSCSWGGILVIVGLGTIFVQNFRMIYLQSKDIRLNLRKHS